MPRPLKQGLDYFPLDVITDDKFELIEAKHEIIGFGILVKLYQKIYKEGYYINWNEEMSLLFSKRINVDINKVNAVINDSLCYHIFNQELFSKYKILTSAGIQKRYFNAIGRRKTVSLYEKYIIVDINPINVNINWINDDISTQSKVKYSKEDLREREELEKIEILKVFQERRFKSPNKEYDRFINHYEKTGWVDANGNTITKPVAAAKFWDERPEVGKLPPKQTKIDPKELWQRIVTDFINTVNNIEATTMILDIEITSLVKQDLTVNVKSESSVNLLEHKYFKQFETSFRKHFPKPIKLHYTVNKS